MRRARFLVVTGLALLVLFLAACEGYSQTGAQSSSRQNASGGVETVRISKANGSAEQEIEIESGGGLILEADVTLSVGKGTYRIELLDEEGQVTLSLEASDGQAVSGHGQMVADAFGEANYRVTATEAEDVEYTIEYTFR
jgi:hypothetical protein